MTRHLHLLLIISLISCTKQSKKSDNKIGLVKQYDYRITIDVWNGFFGHEAKYILNNSQIGVYDSTDSRFNLAKPFTLYYFSNKQITEPGESNIRAFVPVDTAQLLFSKEQSDTLFDLTRSFFKSVEFNNYDNAINGTISKLTVSDDSHASVELKYRGRTLYATISSISNPIISTRQLDTLLNFISKFRPSKK